jgi:Ca-activated chloride channel family protein
VNLFKKIPLAIFLLALLTVCANASQSGLWLQGMENQQRVEAFALQTDVDIEVTGMLAYTTVSRRFLNDADQWAEGRYQFPLPDDSAVESLTIMVDGRLIEGEIQERGQARQTYDLARTEGRSAGLVIQEQANLFGTSITNIPPGAEIEIRIGFRQVVEFEHGRFSLRFPTSNAFKAMRLQVKLRPGMELASLESSFHLIETDFDGDSWMVTLDGGFDNSPQDFELIWRPARSSRVQSAAFIQHLGGLDHALLMMVPPQTFSAQQTPREVIMIIDTSGSMRGSPMIQARESLQFSLDQLGAQDRFNVIEFNHVTRPLFAQPMPASNGRIEQARRFVNGLEGSGGTVMGPSLAMAMHPTIPDGYLRQIVFMTDGLISNETEIIDQIRRDIGHSRLFTVGIGNGVNSQFLRDGARFGRGSYTYIGDLNQIHQRMSELISQLTSPVLHDIELHWPGDVESHPQRLPDLYTGQPLVVSARGESLSGDLLVTAMSDGRPWQQIIPLDAFQIAPGVAAHWGRAAIQGQLDQRGPGVAMETVRQGVLDLALEYQLLSPFTSLVAVDRTPERSRQIALRRHENAGHNEIYARGMPATDAGSWDSMVRGLLALLLVGLLLGHKRLSRDPDDGEPS